MPRPRCGRSRRTACAACCPQLLASYSDAARVASCHVEAAASGRGRDAAAESAQHVRRAVARGVRVVRQRLWYLHTGSINPSVSENARQTRAQCSRAHQQCAQAPAVQAACDLRAAEVQRGNAVPCGRSQDSRQCMCTRKISSSSMRLRCGKGLEAAGLLARKALRALVRLHAKCPPAILHESMQRQSVNQSTLFSRLTVFWSAYTNLRREGLQRHAQHCTPKARPQSCGHSPYGNRASIQSTFVVAAPSDELVCCACAFLRGSRRACQAAHQMPAMRPQCWAGSPRSNRWSTHRITLFHAQKLSCSE